MVGLAKARPNNVNFDYESVDFIIEGLRSLNSLFDHKTHGLGPLFIASLSSPKCSLLALQSHCNCVPFTQVNISQLCIH